MEALGKLILAQEDSKLTILLFQGLVLLIEEILHVFFEFTLHFSNLWRDNMSQSFVHARDLGKFFDILFILK